MVDVWETEEETRVGEILDTGHAFALVYSRMFVYDFMVILHFSVRSPKLNSPWGSCLKLLKLNVSRSHPSLAENFDPTLARAECGTRGRVCHDGRAWTSREAQLGS